MITTRIAIFAALFVFCASIAIAEDTLKIDVAKEPWLVETARGASKLPHRMMWANSVKYKPIAEVVGGPIEVEHWVNEAPKNIAGKFVLIEVWATWCPPCRRSLALLEFYREKYKDELVVVSICETDEEALKKMEGPMKLADIKAPLAVDTHRRFANTLGVWGIPHVVLIEPIHGAVVWEGMPTFAGYELTDQILGKILANLKRPAIQDKLPKIAPFEFKACPPDPNKPNERPRAEPRCAGGDDGTVVEN